MRQRFWETTSFKQLETEYNELLKKNGFVDIEVHVNGEKVLSQYAAKAHWQPKTLSRLGKLKYYEDLLHHAYNFNFESNIDQVILCLRAEGKSIKNILLELNKIGINKHRETIRFIIRRYEHSWGLKNWTLKQRNLKQVIK